MQSSDGAASCRSSAVYVEGLVTGMDDDEPKIDLYEMGARVLNVIGTRGARVLIEMPTKVAEALFPVPLDRVSRTGLVEAVERDIAGIAERDEAVANSALAATALALAYEIENPYNSATSKSMCSGQLRDTLNRLWEMVPPAEKKDGLDDLTARREARLSARGAAS